MRKIINKNEKGITLIALVITIIVLLILAGIAISMLSGENGILRQAAKAKQETEEKSTDEQVKLAALSALTAGHGKMNLGVLKDELSNIEGYTGDIDSFPANVKINESDYVITEKGEVMTVVTDVTQLTTAVKEKTIYYDTTAEKTTIKKAVIPEGYRVSDVSTEQNIDTGLVVIAPDGSEFVWVPVDDVTDMNEKVTLLYDEEHSVDDSANGVTLAKLQKTLKRLTISKYLKFILNTVLPNS